MRKSALILTIVICASWLVFEPVGAQQKRRHTSTTISVDDDKAFNDCSQIRMRFHDAETARAQLQQTVPLSAISALQVHPSRNGGVHVEGWSRDEYMITACLAASGDTMSDAKTLLDQIKLSVRDGKVTVEGPTPEDWLAYLIVEAPHGATLDLSGTNGPIGVRGFNGNVQARNQNGPITFRNVSGQVSAEVQNGPITVVGSSGHFRLNAQNGPLTVELDGNQWSGGELEGSTQNGPLILKLPENYMSSVRVDASKHSPVECRTVQCQQAVRTWDRPNVIQFGDSNPVIRLSTVNGPVTITSSGSTK